MQRPKIKLLTLKERTNCMLFSNNISLSVKFQQFEGNSFETFTENGRSVFHMHSTQETKELMCPICCGKVHVNSQYTVKLKTLPFFPGIWSETHVDIHRYQCQECGYTFTEDIPFRHEGTLVTERAAECIKCLLILSMPISHIHCLTGIHWDTIRKIHCEVMDTTLEERQKELKEAGYKPRYLAVDEFAIHKGHSYATCVMDLEQGDIIWVGKGRAKNDFIKFFQETDRDYLSEVKAIAMDMNASYNILVEKYMPGVDIVYDRYHMQSQYGKEVLGVVRLNDAREHNYLAKSKKAEALAESDPVKKRRLKAEAKEESKHYAELKSSRWMLLTKNEKLTPKCVDKLNEIISEHEDLAICYAMKEEMCRLFDLDDVHQAEEGWKRWFDAAKASNIPALVKFAEIKEKRLEGLINHAKHGISTGKLEGMNNKIKVAKRIGYGFRNEQYFFTLIKYLSIPKVRNI